LHQAARSSTTHGTPPPDDMVYLARVWVWVWASVSVSVRVMVKVRVQVRVQVRVMARVKGSAQWRTSARG